MKVLLDSCVSGLIVQPALVEAGHDVVWAGDWESDPGDEVILAHAHRESRVLVTLDKDFGALAFNTVTRIAASCGWPIWRRGSSRPFACMSFPTMRLN